MLNSNIATFIVGVVAFLFMTVFSTVMYETHKAEIKRRYWGINKTRFMDALRYRQIIGVVILFFCIYVAFIQK